MAVQDVDLSPSSVDVQEDQLPIMAAAVEGSAQVIVVSSAVRLMA